MEAKLTITEDTVTEYLNKLDELSSDVSNNRRFIRSAGQEMHFDYIAPLMPKWNPNLMYSPLEPDNQIIDISDGLTTIELIYTGFTEDAKMNALPKGVWSEFGDKTQGILERDYAYYQETGDDPIADNFEGHWFATRGTLRYNDMFRLKTIAYLNKLTHLEKWKGAKKVHLEDYIE